MKQKRKRKRTRHLGLLIIIGIILLLVLLYHGGRWLETRNEKPEARGDLEQRYAHEDITASDGSVWRKRKNVTTILLMGIDRDSSAVATGYRNGGQADFLRLMVVDNEARTISQLQIDRDTMTPITILGVLGNQSGVRTSQICLSHGFGDGKEQSCELTRDAVSNLLLGTPIDYYVAMNLDGISVLNDWAGGIEVTLEDDFSSVDPSMTLGRTMTLVGDQAETYVRSRRNIGIGTNEARMQRQQVYITSLSGQMQEKIQQSESEVAALYDMMQPYLVTDMAKGRLINEIWTARDYQTVTFELDGEYTIGSDGFMQFIADEVAIQDTILNLFYTKLK